MNFNLPDTPVDGIILRTFPCRDTDLVLRVLTRTHGKIPVLARGARRRTKKMPISLDLFDAGTFTIVAGRGSLPVLEAFTPTQSFRLIRESLPKLSCASTLCESFDFLTPEYGDESSQLYEVCFKTVEAINHAPDAKSALRETVWGLAAVLAISGYYDPKEEILPSAKTLVDLVSRVEHFAERPLLSKSMLISIISGLRVLPSTDKPSTPYPNADAESLLAAEPTPQEK